MSRFPRLAPNPAVPITALLVALLALSGCSPARPASHEGAAPRPRHTTTPPALTTLAEGEQWIVYQWGSPCGTEPTSPDTICLARPDGTGRHALPTTGGSDALHPDWSPDGDSITYSQDEAIWTVAVNGGAPKKVAECAGCIGLDYPAWSPDGKTIAYSRYGERELPGGAPSDDVIETVDVGSGTIRALTKATTGKLADQPRWSPDGKELVVQVDRIDATGVETGGALAIVSVTGGPLRLITKYSAFASYPDWNPTSDQIVFVTHDYDPNRTNVELNIIDANGKGQHTITKLGERPKKDLANQPSWTPDGKQIVFVQWNARLLTRIEPDGSGLATIPGFPVSHPRFRPLV